MAPVRATFSICPIMSGALSAALPAAEKSFLASARNLAGLARSAISSRAGGASSAAIPKLGVDTPHETFGRKQGAQDQGQVWRQSELEFAQQRENLLKRLRKVALIADNVLETVDHCRL